MRKFAALILMIAVAAGVAEVLRGQTGADEPMSASVATSGDSVPSVRPSIAWSVLSKEGDGRTYAYSLETNETTGPVETHEGPRASRINQSSNLCGLHPRRAPGPLRVDCDGMTADSVLAISDKESDAQLLVRAIDLKSLGITTLPDGAYLIPIGVSDDKASVYLAPRVEGQSWIAGLWKLDVATGKASEIAYVRERKLYQYEINPATAQLIGVTFTPPEGIGDVASGPFRIEIVDLSDGTGRTLREQEFLPYENPMLSPNADSFAYYEDGRASVASLERASDDKDDVVFRGVIRDWFDDTLVFDRDGNLFLYDLKARTETQITHETEAIVEYLGIVT